MALPAETMTRMALPLAGTMTPTRTALSTTTRTALPLVGKMIPTRTALPTREATTRITLSTVEAMIPMALPTPQATTRMALPPTVTMTRTALPTRETTTHMAQVPTAETMTHTAALSNPGGANPYGSANPGDIHIAHPTLRMALPTQANKATIHNTVLPTMAMMIITLKLVILLDHQTMSPTILHLVVTRMIGSAKVWHSQRARPV